MRYIFWYFLSIILVSCSRDTPYLSGHLKRVFDAEMVPCAPYENDNQLQTCAVVSSAFQETIYVYDVNHGLVPSPMEFLPLKLKVGTLTNELVKVVSQKTRFPYLLAIDHQSPSYYPIKLFPSADGTEPSFLNPTKVALEKLPFKTAAFETGDKVLAIMTFPKEGRVEIRALNPQSGTIDESVAKKSLNIGSAPGYVVIDDQGKMAVISDEREDNIYALDLSNLVDVLTGTAAPNFYPIDVGMKAERLYLSNRNFGDQEELYAMAFSAVGKAIALVNIVKKKREAHLSLDEYPKAGYFPDNKSSTCCDGVKDWFAVISLSGKLQYIAIEKGQSLSLKKASTVDLISETNMSLGSLQLAKIVGGPVVVPPDNKEELLCKNNRYMFYFSEYAASISFLDKESQEVEGHGKSCEGGSSASLFGYKNK